MSQYITLNSAAFKTSYPRNIAADFTNFLNTKILDGLNKEVGLCEVHMTFNGWIKEAKLVGVCTEIINVNQIGMQNFPILRILHVQPTVETTANAIVKNNKDSPNDPFYSVVVNTEAANNEKTSYTKSFYFSNVHYHPLSVQNIDEISIFLTPVFDKRLTIIDLPLNEVSVVLHVRSQGGIQQYK